MPRISTIDLYGNMSTHDVASVECAMQAHILHLKYPYYDDGIEWYYSDIESCVGKNCLKFIRHYKLLRG